jgi:cytokinin riboside 5'-monophosphate phosphoribohydrolase
LAHHFAECHHVFSYRVFDHDEIQLSSTYEKTPMKPSPAICVFSSSSDAIDRNFFSAALELGMEIALRNGTLVYGGTNIGLMGAVARATQKHGGHVIGVIPEFLRAKGITFTSADELIVTHDMRERKATMESRSDAFVALPGGFGTLEEMIEIITLKQLRQHVKPVVFLDIDNFYRPLQRLFEHMISNHFAKEAMRQIYHFATDVPRAFHYLDSYEPPKLDDKWFRAEEISEINTDRE